MKTFKNHLALNRGDLLGSAGITFGAWLIPTLIVLGIMIATGESKGMEVGGIVAFVVAVVVQFLVSLTHCVVSIKMGVQMGRTRRFMLAAILAESTLNISLLLALCAALSGLSSLLAKFLPFSEYVNLLFIMPWWVWPACIVGTVVLSLCLAMTIHAGGRLGFWIIWCIFMLIFVVPSNVPGVMDKLTQTLQWLKVAGVLSGIAILGWFCWSIWYALRCSVKE